MKQPAVSRADLIRAVCGDAALYGYVAEQLGLEYQPTPPEDLKTFVTFDLPCDTRWAEESRAETREVVSRPCVPFWQTRRLKERNLSDRKMIDLDHYSETDKPGLKVDSPPVPVVIGSFARLATFTEVFTRLRHRTELERPGRLIDIDRLVCVLSEARDLQHVPRLNRKTLGDGLHIVIDLARRLIPYREDQREIARQLKRLLPNNGASVSVLRESHERPLIQWPEERDETPLEPAPGDTILALSDLGTLDQFSSTAEKTWERLGRNWLDRRCRMLSLVPCRVDHIPKRMTEWWSPVQWDRFSSLGPTPTEAETVAARERLLVLLSQSIRIEPQLVRLVRRLFAEGIRNPGLESLVWQFCSTRNSDHCTAAALSWADAEQCQHDLAGDQLAHPAWRLIQEFHKAEYEGVRIAESANLRSEAWKMLSPGERHQVREWFQTLWKMVNVQGENVDERADFFTRVSPFLSEDAFEKIPVLHRLQHRLCPNDAPPKGYDPALAGVNDAPLQVIRVSQVGGQFEYRRRGGMPERYSPLATIRLKNPEIVIDSFDDWPDEDPDNAFWLDGVAPPWADRWGRDDVGPWVEFVIGETRQRMRWIPPGEFLMGSAKKPTIEGYAETPQQLVSISRGFWLFDTPCTQELWQAVMGENPSHFKEAQRPVEKVSWEDCQTFNRRLGALCPGLALTLPTEAEWEYACRAGSEMGTYGGDGSLGEIAWFSENAGNKTHPVGELQPNDFGLFDMLGNVWEWCRDHTGRQYGREPITDPLHETGDSSAIRVFRGGCWDRPARFVRAASRLGAHPGYCAFSLGFRCSSSVSEPGTGGWRRGEEAGGRRPQVVRSQRAVRGWSRRGAGGDSEPASEDRLVRVTERDSEYAPVPQGPIVRLRTDLEDVFLCQITRPRWANRIGRDQFGLWAEFTIQRKDADDVSQRLRWIPPGRFLMGSPESEKGHYADEGPQNAATVAAGFWLFDTPCTQALWNSVMGDNPSRFKGERRPVEQVSWQQASEFVSKLSEVVGLRFQLPSETQWEYACRAGHDAATYAGDFDPDDIATQQELQQIAWYSANASGETHNVGELRPNPWGLYDMLGNVFEWCRDTWCDRYDQAREEDKSSAIRVIRGGSWDRPAQNVRAAYRNGSHPGFCVNYLGFRCSSSGDELRSG